MTGIPGEITLAATGTDGPSKISRGAQGERSKTINKQPRIDNPGGSEIRRPLTIPESLQVLGRAVTIEQTRKKIELPQKANNVIPISRTAESQQALQVDQLSRKDVKQLRQQLDKLYKQAGKSKVETGQVEAQLTLDILAAEHRLTTWELQQQTQNSAIESSQQPVDIAQARMRLREAKVTGNLSDQESLAYDQITVREEVLNRESQANFNERVETVDMGLKVYERSVQDYLSKNAEAYSPDGSSRAQRIFQKFGRRMQLARIAVTIASFTGFATPAVIPIALGNGAFRCVDARRKTMAMEVALDTRLAQGHADFIPDSYKGSVQQDVQEFMQAKGPWYLRARQGLNLLTHPPLLNPGERSQMRSLAKIGVNKVSAEALLHGSASFDALSRHNLDFADTRDFTLQTDNGQTTLGRKESRKSMDEAIADTRRGKDLQDGLVKLVELQYRILHAPQMIRLGASAELMDQLQSKAAELENALKQQGVDTGSSESRDLVVRTLAKQQIQMNKQMGVLTGYRMFRDGAVSTVTTFLQGNAGSFIEGAPTAFAAGTTASTPESAVNVIAGITEAIHNPAVATALAASGITMERLSRLPFFDRRAARVTVDRANPNNITVIESSTSGIILRRAVGAILRNTGGGLTGLAVGGLLGSGDLKIVTEAIGAPLGAYLEPRIMQLLTRRLGGTAESRMNRALLEIPGMESDMTKFYHDKMGIPRGQTLAEYMATRVSSRDVSNALQSLIRENRRRPTIGFNDYPSRDQIFITLEGLMTREMHDALEPIEDHRPLMEQYEQAVLLREMGLMNPGFNGNNAVNIVATYLENNIPASKFAGEQRALVAVAVRGYLKQIGQGTRIRGQDLYKAIEQVVAKDMNEVVNTLSETTTQNFVSALGYTPESTPKNRENLKAAIKMAITAAKTSGQEWDHKNIMRIIRIANGNPAIFRTQLLFRDDRINPNADPRTQIETNTDRRLNRLLSQLADNDINQLARDMGYPDNHTPEEYRNYVIQAIKTANTVSANLRVPMHTEDSIATLVRTLVTESQSKRVKVFDEFLFDTARVNAAFNILPALGPARFSQTELPQLADALGVGAQATAIGPTRPNDIQTLIQNTLRPAGQNEEKSLEIVRVIRKLAAESEVAIPPRVIDTEELGLRMQEIFLKGKSLIDVFNLYTDPTIGGDINDIYRALLSLELRTANGALVTTPAEAVAVLTSGRTLPARQLAEVLINLRKVRIKVPPPSQAQLDAELPLAIEKAFTKNITQALKVEGITCDEATLNTALHLGPGESILTALAVPPATKISPAEISIVLRRLVQTRRAGGIPTPLTVEDIALALEKNHTPSLAALISRYTGDPNRQAQIIGTARVMQLPNVNNVSHAEQALQSQLTPFSPDEQADFVARISMAFRDIDRDIAARRITALAAQDRRAAKIDEILYPDINTVINQIPGGPFIINVTNNLGIPYSGGESEARMELTMYIQQYEQATGTHVNLIQLVRKLRADGLNIPGLAPTEARLARTLGETLFTSPELALRAYNLTSNPQNVQFAEIARVFHVEGAQDQSSVEAYISQLLDSRPNDRPSIAFRLAVELNKLPPNANLRQVVSAINRGLSPNTAFAAPYIFSFLRNQRDDKCVELVALISGVAHPRIGAVPVTTRAQAEEYLSNIINPGRGDQVLETLQGRGIPLNSQKPADLKTLVDRFF